MDENDDINSNCVVDPETEFDAIVAEAARRVIERLGLACDIDAAKYAANRAYEAAGCGVTYKFIIQGPPMTPAQAKTLRSLCGRFDNVEYPENATKQEAHELISDLLDQLRSRKPRWQQ
ncbi:MAG TPA: hypothetical protein VHU61_08520 [Solirubrobacteraceae bacterium]|jgi:hypothetical protein|nr:hypothetical protein [Solirubrobacteraceae bacterium]